MATSVDFGKMVPGFDFLQNLMKGAGTALPGVGQWVAPTLDPEELTKRIEELRTVQFWLEQNVRMLASTIQALEVQRMTLSTLKTMNLQVSDMAEAFTLKPPPAAAAQAAEPAAQPAPEPAPTAKARRPSAAGKATTSTAAGGASSGPAVGLVDPMQWWGALTQQFTEIASQAVKESGLDAARGVAGALGPQAAQVAAKAMKAAADLPARAMKQATRATRKSPARRKA